MHRTVFPPSHDSIFGDTYHGVMNPRVPHRHPYPTRYHGPIYTVPGVAKLPYRERPYAKAPYVGFGDTAPIFAHVTGSGPMDAVLGAGLGYVLAPKKEDKPMWTVVGALAAYMAGTAGLLGVGAAALWKRKLVR